MRSMDSNSSDKLDPTTKNFLQQIESEVNKTKLVEQVNSFTNRCWDVCLSDSRTPSKMDGKTLTCLDNCVNRMVDASAYLAEHLQKLNNQSASRFS